MRRWNQILVVVGSSPSVWKGIRVTMLFYLLTCIMQCCYIQFKIAHNFFICAWIFTKFGGIYSGTGRKNATNFEFHQTLKISVKSAIIASQGH